jgi:hypothetical protein
MLIRLASRAPAAAVLVLSAALLASSVYPGKGSALLPQGSGAIPDGGSIGRWLWPGAFETVPSGAASRVTFVASGRRYVAEVRAEGFDVRQGTRAADALNVEFAGATGTGDAQLAGPLPGALTMFTGLHNRAVESRWRRFEVVTFRNVYPGIDARFRANDGDLELDFLVQPGADPGRIELAGRRDTHFTIDAQTGDILLSRANERFRLQRPRAFQPETSGRTEIEVRAATDGRSLRFELPRFNHALPLVIDPLVATWSTFLGTATDAMYDDAAALATDAQGNLYVGGLTALDTHAIPTDSFPTTPTSLDPANPRSPGDNCAYTCGYVLKLTPTHQVVYGALIYGLTVKAVAVDAAGEAYITGNTLDSTNFPGTPGVFDNDPGGQVFLSKLSADGSAFVFSALFPGDVGNGLAVDAQGNAYVVGQVSVPNLPTTPGTIKPTNPIGATINQDGFLLKVSADGTRLLYGTYLGGSGADVANAVLVDAQGEAIVAGQTASSDFTGLTATVNGPSDAFLIKVSADASHIVAGQIFGGSGDDYATALAADGLGGWLMCGATTSTDLPVSPRAFQTRLLGQRNGWVRRLDSGFNSKYLTYFGGSFIDGCLGIAADASGDAYLVGVTFSADLPTSPGAFQEATSAVTDEFLINLGSPFYISGHMPDREAYFAELSADGTTVLYGTYLGGYETTPRNYAPLTFGSGITNTPLGTVYVSGATEAASFPVTDRGLRSGMGGQQDGFIVAFANSSLSITTPALLPAAPLSLPYSVTLSATGGTAPYAWSQVGFELPTGITLSSSGVLSGTATNPQQEGTGYQFTVKVADATGAAAYKSMFANVLYPGQFLCESNNCVAALVAKQGISYQLPTIDRAVGQVTGTATGTVPQGITLSSSGLLAGTPLQSGVYGFVVHLQDQSGQTGTMNWLMWIAPNATPVAALTVAPTSVTVGQNYTLTWGASDSSGCEASNGGANGAPWTGVFPNVGTTTQTATAVGTFTYTVTCPTGGAPVQASANLAVSQSSSGGGGGGSGGGAGGGGGHGGGGGLGWLELAGLLAAAAGQRRVGALHRRNR